MSLNNHFESYAHKRLTQTTAHHATQAQMDNMLLVHSTCYPSFICTACYIGSHGQYRHCSQLRDHQLTNWQKLKWGTA